MDGKCVVVGRESGMARLPGVQECDALLVEQPLCSEKGDHLLTEELLGHAGADVGHGVPGTGPVPAAAGGEGVDVGVPSQVGRRGVDGGDHAGPNVIPGGRGDELSHRLPCRLAELAEQRSVMEKVGTQELPPHPPPRFPQLHAAPTATTGGSTTPPRRSNRGGKDQPELTINPESPSRPPPHSSH